MYHMRNLYAWGRKVRGGVKGGIVMGMVAVRGQGAMMDVIVAAMNPVKMLCEDATCEIDHLLEAR